MTRSLPPRSVDATRRVSKPPGRRKGAGTQTATRGGRGRTPRMSFEAVRPSVLAAGAHGGTSACRTDAAVSFVSCIRSFDAAEFHLLKAVFTPS